VVGGPDTEHVDRLWPPLVLCNNFMRLPLLHVILLEKYREGASIEFLRSIGITESRIP
jgi:hypothetical protein